MESPAQRRRDGGDGSNDANAFASLVLERVQVDRCNLTLDKIEVEPRRKFSMKLTPAVGL